MLSVPKLLRKVCEEHVVYSTLKEIIKGGFTTKNVVKN
jgi:hypothetical protein